MTDLSQQVLPPEDRRGNRWIKYGWVLLTNWRRIAAAVFYFTSAMVAAKFAWELACMGGRGSALRIPMIAGLGSWTIVGLVRAFEGRFLAGDKDKLAKLTPGERLVCRWLQATVTLSILLLAAQLIDKLVP